MCESCLSEDANGGMTCEEWFDSNNHEGDGDGEGLLQESEYGYTVTGSNDAGESSEGHTVKMSGGAEEFFDVRGG